MMNLADPELELIDPTPNVHALFVHFDKIFFWAKLSSRCVVRWSKRMYSCAGSCSYGGKNQVCDIALSEPLLKLRPRKDLVETLLHEMIHAFLFVTRQDQNRDGHGPNFLAHMHRINKAAGLNISVYHDFNDEVELYLTHWWRCDGPCKSRRPHFGIVRRSNNKAPGPTDYWWKTHQRNCGGTFLKIKEPDTKLKKSKKADLAKPNADIKKYIINNNKTTNNKNILDIDKCKVPVLKDSSNVFDKRKESIKSNNSSTLIISRKNPIFNPQATKPNSVIVNSIGIETGKREPNTGERKRTSSTGVFETVRNVWANKQIVTNNNKEVSQNNNINKKEEKLNTDSPPRKIKKIDDYFKTAVTSVLQNLYGEDLNIMQVNGQKLKVIPKKLNTVYCPVCNSEIESNDINRHLDECLNTGLIKELSNNALVVKNEPKKIKGDSTISHSNVKQGTLNETVDLTINGFSTDVSRKRSRTSCDSDFGKSGDIGTIENKNDRQSGNFKGPIISNIKQDITAEHVLPNSVAKIEAGSSKPDITLEVACPCCGDKLNTSVDEHLDDCLSFFENNTTIPVEGASTSHIGETIVIDDEDDEFDESQIFNETGTKLPCPCCLKMIEEIDMNCHLDTCLNS